MPIENQTVNRGYELPNPANFLSDDVLRLMAMIEGVDVEVATLLATLANKSWVGHGHLISEITNLQAALDAKAGIAHTHTVSQISDLQTALDAKAGLASPNFSGNPTTPDQLVADNSTRLANTKFVKAQAPNVTGDLTATGTIGTGFVFTIAAGAVTLAKMAASVFASVAEIMGKTGAKLLTVANLWDSAAWVSVSYAADQQLDFATFINARITLTGNVVLGATTNVKKGTSGYIEFTHSGAVRSIGYNITYYQTAGNSLLVEGTTGSTELYGWLARENGKIELFPASVI